MSCSRCNGCMVDDFLLDMEDSSGPMWLQAKRCMNCGNVAESVLQRNRETQGVRLHSPTSSAPAGSGATVSMGAEAMSNLAA